MTKKIMIKIIPSLFFLLCVYAHPSCSAANNEFVTRYKCLDSRGNERWTAETAIRSAPEENIFLLTEKGGGIYSGFKGEISWVAELEFESTKTSIKPLYMEKTVYDKSGDELEVETHEFKYGKDTNEVVFTLEDKTKNREKSKKFRFDGDIANRLMLGLYIQKFLANGKTRGTVNMISSEPRFYKVNLKILDTKKIDVNGRSRNAYKLCLDPELGIFNFVKAVLPKGYVWHSASGKYEWLMYKGVESTVTSPRVRIITLDEL